jgi:hypothetical protein
VWAGGVNRYIPLNRIETQLLIGTLLLCVVSQFIHYTAKFAHDIYPVLPQQVGGGRPREAQLLFFPEHLRAIEALGVPLCGLSGRTQNVKILLDDETRLVITTGAGVVTDLKRELVDGIKSPPSGCTQP